MKTLKEALFSRRNLNSNPYGLTKDDLKGGIKDFPMGVVVRMMEEQEKQYKRSDIEAFQEHVTRIVGGFDWEGTCEGWDFWAEVINNKDFDLFFKEYPEYARYNIS